MREERGEGEGGAVTGDAIDLALLRNVEVDLRKTKCGWLGHSDTSSRDVQSAHLSPDNTSAEKVNNYQVSGPHATQHVTLSWCCPTNMVSASITTGHVASVTTRKPRTNQSAYFCDVGVSLKFDAWNRLPAETDNSKMADCWRHIVNRQQVSGENSGRTCDGMTKIARDELPPFTKSPPIKFEKIINFLLQY